MEVEEEEEEKVEVKLNGWREATAGIWPAVDPLT